MKKLLVGLLFVVGLGLGALAQNTLTARAYARFAQVEFLDPDGDLGGRGPFLFVGSIEVNADTSCYFLTPVDISVALESVSQIVSLGCVK
jgi:hypothetical protein